MTAAIIPPRTHHGQQESPLQDVAVKDWIIGGGIYVELRRRGDKFELSTIGPKVCASRLQSALKTEEIGKQTFVMVDALHRQRQTHDVDEGLANALKNGDLHPYPRLIDNPYENQKDAFPTCYRTWFDKKEHFTASTLDPNIPVNVHQWAISFVSRARESSDLVKESFAGESSDQTKAKSASYFGHTELFLEGRDPSTDKYFVKRLHLTVADKPKIETHDFTDIFSENPQTNELTRLKTAPHTSFPCTKEGGKRLLDLAATQEKDPSSVRYAALSGGTFDKFKKDWLNLPASQNCTEWGLHGLGVAGITYCEEGPFVERPGLYLQGNNLPQAIEKTFKCVTQDWMRYVLFGDRMMYVVGVMFTFFHNNKWIRQETTRTSFYTENNTREIVDLTNSQIPLDRVCPQTLQRQRTFMDEITPMN